MRFFEAPKVFAAFVFSISACSVCAEPSPLFIARTEDQSVQQMVARWVSERGETLKWEALSDMPIKVPAAEINGAAKLAAAKSYPEAIDRHNALLDKPLQVCIFKNVVVVRAIDQAECKIPLN